MNEENFTKWERIVVRLGGLILLVIVIAKIIAAEVGIRLFH